MPYLAGKRRRQRVLSPADSRAPVRRAAHGLTAREITDLIVLQGGRCALCGKGGRKLEIDHDHRHCPGTTGCRACVRGALCGTCNSALGRFGDAMIPALIRYLSR
jgi:hypothetical protein